MNKGKYLQNLTKWWSELSFGEKFVLLRKACEEKEITVKQYKKMTEVDGYSDEARIKVVFDLWLKTKKLSVAQVRKTRTKFIAKEIENDLPFRDGIRIKLNNPWGREFNLKQCNI